MRPGPSARLALPALGWASLQAQVGLLRELLVAASGNELALFPGLACWMTGTALGALATGPSLRLPRLRTWTAVRLGLLGLALAVPAAALLLRLLRPLAAEPPGVLLPLGVLALGTAPAFALPGLLSGWLFARTAACAAVQGTPLGTAYGLESLGGLAGGLLATVLPAAGLDTLSVILGAAGLAGLAAAMLADGAGRAAWLPVPLLLLGALPFSHRLDLRLSRIALPALVDVRDTPYGRVAVTSRLGQSAVFLDGALAFENQGTAAEETAHAAALMVERPRRILLLGGAAEGLLPELLQHHPAQVDCVELDSGGLELALLAAPAGTREALGAPGVRLLRADPRRFLETARERYDLILSVLPEPRTSASNRMWTREAFEAFRRRLRPGGVLALRLQAPENLWPPLERQRGASLLRALRGPFRTVRLLPGAAPLLLASDGPLPRDATLPLARWRTRGLHTRAVSEASMAWRLQDPRGPELETALQAESVPSNEDARPICHPLTLALGLSRFAPRLSSASRLPARAWMAAAILALCAAAGLAGLALRAPAQREALALAALAGAGGMLLQASLLLAFQARHGVLYQDLGLLLTLFMGGMAGGAALRTPRPGPLLAGLAGLALASALAVSHPARLPWALVAGLLALSGATGGALFGTAGRLAPAGSGPLYAADLAGGCAGALLAGLGLPFVSLPAGPLLVAGLALEALLLGRPARLRG